MKPPPPSRLFCRILSKKGPIVVLIFYRMHPKTGGSSAFRNNKGQVIAGSHINVHKHTAGKKMELQASKMQRRVPRLPASEEEKTLCRVFLFVQEKLVKTSTFRVASPHSFLTPPRFFKGVICIL